MEESIDHSQFDENTPVYQAMIVVSCLADVWEMWNFSSKVDFMEFIFEGMWNDEDTSGERQFDELKKTEEMTDWNGEPFVPGFKPAIVQIATMQVACAFAIEALKAEDDRGRAWVHVCRAHHWLGILQGTISGRGMQSAVAATLFANAGADKRHAENRAMKSSVFDWCETNIEKYTSLDSAAQAIAGKLVPVTFRTARTWIGEWKKRRSAGRL